MSLTKTLLRTQATLLRRALTQSPTQLIGTVIIAILIIATTIGMAISAVNAYHSTGSADLFVLTMGMGSMLYIGSSFLSPSSETQIEPQYLATLPLSANNLLPGLLVSKFIQVGSLIAVANTFIMASAGAAVFPPTGAIGWVIACIGQLLITLYLGESLSLYVGSLQGTRFQELLGLAGAVAIALMTMFFIVSVNTIGSIDPRPVVAIISWTPFAFAAAAAAAASFTTPSIPLEIHPSGTAGGVVDPSFPFPALAMGLAAVLTLLGAIALWYVAVRRLIVAPVRTSGSSIRRHTTRSLLLPGLPKNQWTALYSRSLRNWLRDSRYIANVLMYPMLAAVYLFISRNDADSNMGWMALIWLSLAGCTLMANEIGMDGPATWLHITSGVSGRSYLTSRIAAHATILVPMVLLAGAALMWLHDITIGLVLAVGFAISLLLMNMAFGALTTVIAPSPTSKPGVNAFRQRNSSTIQGPLLALIFSFVSFVLSTPALILVFLSGAFHQPTYNSNMLLLGALVQAGVCAAVVTICLLYASRRLDRSWQLIFSKVRSWT